MDFVTFKSPSHPALNALAAQINSEAKIAGIPPCLLAAIAMRETGGKNIFQYGMPHAPGCGVGVCQITAGVNWSNAAAPTFAGYKLLDVADNLYVAAAYFLRPLMTDAARWQRDDPAGFQAAFEGQQAYAIAAGFNAGEGADLRALQLRRDVDASTTDDYAHGVFAFYTAFVAESHA
jgi:hypothetical protein